MNTQASPRLDSSTVAMRLGMCAAALAGTAATVTDANAVVVTFTTPISVPQNGFGIYINLLTGATGTAAASVTGWDFNPYQSNGGTQLGFYWAPTPANTSGGVATTAATGPYLSLTAGSVVSSMSIFTRAINPTANFQTAGTHVLGFRINNEVTGLINYGYLTMTNGGPVGFPATITGWSVENNGGSITVVPEPSTGAMLSVGALALGAVNLRRLRRQRRLATH